MNQVFNAKRQIVEFEYEFLNGTTKTVAAQNLSSKEQSDVIKAQGTTRGGVAFIKSFESTIRKQLIKNDKKVVDKIIKEQFDEGDLVEFSNAIATLVRETKVKK